MPDESKDAIQRAIVIANHRTFEQNPRLARLALSEISRRALEENRREAEVLHSKALSATGIS